MLSYFSRDKTMAGRRIGIALFISCVAHLFVLLSFNQFRTGVSAGYQGNLNIYLQPARNQEGNVAGFQRENVANESVETSVARSVKKTLPVTKEAAPSKSVKRLPADPPKSNQSQSPDDNSTAAVRQNEKNESKSQAGHGGGVVDGGQIKRVKIDFEVRTGVEKRLVSSGRHVYVSEREYFGISVSDVPPVGQGAMTQWRIEISGRVNAQGLSPILYETQGILPQELIALKESGAIKPALGKEQLRKWQMPDGVLDRQSLLYHFMFKPPEISGGQVWLSDGINHALYTYQIGGTEALPIAGMGNVSTLRLVFTTTTSQERIELWLLPDRHYLPLKARYTDGQGVLTEQTATSIDYE